MKLLKYIIGIIAVMVIVITTAGIYKFNYLANKSEYNRDGNKYTASKNSNNENESIGTTNATRTPSKFVCVGEYCDGSAQGDDLELTVLQIPLIQDGGTIGCGAEIFFAPHGISKTKTPLDETYKLLFDLKPVPEIQIDSFRNPIGNYTQLLYKSVILKDGIAKVYLTGNLYSPGHCSLPEIRAQITSASLRFNTVNTVEVYLNGTVYNWCEQDQSDGEGLCPETPDYWTETK